MNSKVISNRKMERKIERLSDTKKMEAEKRTNCFLDILLDLQEQNDFTDEDIREEVETFMFEGHDTVSSSLGFMVFWLGHREKLQEKLRTEMREIFNSDVGRDVTLDDMTKMRYAESCIRETMRLLPTVPVRSYDFIRICHLDNWSCDYRTHRNRRYFHNPDEFDPDHFTTERVIVRFER
uniref:Cytochrome P450 n=1 Tax=Meloidogyne floridensis TaxID=298350 RepID=A0A915P3R5_9BILA